ncbi:MAG: hypothetical protein JO328_17945 [Hyphomicrobiales bacterium]|nr:hypothetical protein [Hyphomicrobiales bacterium]MBV8825826.1 hypothetical protein [Hyphomicrobiales bacterium]
MPRRLNINVPWFRRQDYEAIKDLLAEERMPVTFEEWHKAAKVHVDDMQARGVNVRTVIIDPREFAAHCAASGMKPTRAALGAFAITMARRGENS